MALEITGLEVVIDGRKATVGAAEVNRAFAGMGQGADKFTSKIRTSMQRAAASIDRLGQRMSALGNKMSLAVTLPLIAAGGAALKMAADVEESENFFSVSFGKMEKSARDWSVTMSKTLGENQFKMREMMATFNEMASGMGFSSEAAFALSKGLNLLVQDLASFRNLSIEEAFQKLQSGITGEIEPLKRLGILVDENTVKQAAVAAGIAKTGETLSQGQKVLARYAAIVQQSNNALGDKARTLGSTQNQFRFFQAQVAENAVLLGQKFLPAVNAALRGLNGMVSMVAIAVEKFMGLDTWLKTLILTAGGMVIAFGPVVKILGLMLTLFSKLILVIAAVVTPMGLAVAAGIALGVAISIIVQNLDVFEKVAKRVWNNVALYATAGALKFMSGLQNIMDPVRSLVPDAMEKAIDSSVDSLARKTLSMVAEMRKNTAEGLTLGFGDAFEEIKNRTGNFLKNLGALISDVVGGFFEPSEVDRTAMGKFVTDEYEKIMKELASKQSLLEAATIGAGAKKGTVSAATKANAKAAGQFILDYQKGIAKAFQIAAKEQVVREGILEALRRQVDANDVLIKNGGELTGQAEEEANWIEFQNRLKDKKITLSATELAQARDYLSKITEQNAAIDAMNNNAEEFDRLWINALEGVQGAFTDFFKDIFDGGVDSFSDLADKILDIFKQLAAELATLMVIKPVLGAISTVTGIGGLLQSAGIGGGGTALGSMLGGGNGLSTMLGFGRSALMSFAPGSAAQALTNFGAMLPGGLGTTLGLSVPATTGLGITGAEAAALGFMPGEMVAGQTATMLGGASMAGIGFAIAAAVFAGIKLLGGSENPRVETQFGIGEGGNVIETFRKFNDIGKEKGTEVADSFSTAITGTMAGLAEAFGIEFEDVTGKFGAQLIRSSKNGFQVKIGDVHYFGRPDDPNDPARRRGTDPETGAVIWVGQSERFGKKEAGFTAAFKFFVERFIEEFSTDNTLPETLATVLTNSTATKIEDLMADINIAALFEKGFIAEPEKVIGPFETALNNMRLVFEEAKPDVERLGLSVEEFADKFAAGAAQIASEFDALVASATLQIANPKMAELDLLQQQFNTTLAEATAIGGDYNGVLELYYEQLKRFLGIQPEVIDMTALATAAFQGAIAEVVALGGSIEEFAANFGIVAETVDDVTNAVADSVETLVEDLTDVLRDEFNQSMTNQVTSMVDPMLGALIDLNTRYNETLAKAVELGGDQNTVNDLYYLQLVELVGVTEQAAEATQKAVVSVSEWESVIGRLSNFRQGLITGNLSPLSPEAKLEEARSQFTDISRRARLGDIGAMADLPGASQTFLEASQAYFASTNAFIADFELVQKTLSKTESVAERHLRVAKRQSDFQQTTAAATSETVRLLREVLSTNPNLGRNPTLNAMISASSGYRGDYGSGGYLDFARSRSLRLGQDLNRPGDPIRADQNAVLAAIMGFTGDFGHGAFSRYVEAGGGTALQRSTAQAYWATLGRDLGFANGGSARIGGTSSDTATAIMGLSGGEVVTVRRSQDQDEMLQEARAQRRATQAGFQALINQIDELTEEVVVLRQKTDVDRRVA
jgi:hypothetical protein